eukprot:CAMPEP_0183339448 /NCGR_PEP_ID=MMETSP0164_2-20130417/6369_1 /TAXON_ID=221442 /ORGANISM="Coccolithus pelagicus ssp braarudi, Strain PLY182g" /LENGTH=280 /DNA_ID=CAMNT_0025509439 /DNA_START=14 /DNA_END=856 /DNA_ORIENTATION=+
MALDPLVASRASNTARCKKYAAMAAQLADEGFNPAAVEKARDMFRFPPPNGTPQPRMYDDKPWELPFPAVRVLAVPIGCTDLAEHGAGLEIARLAMDAAAAVVAELPQGSEFYLQEKGTMHCTVFHPSSPHQPSPLDAAGLEQEMSVISALVGSLDGPMQLQVERIVMTPGGVMLLLLHDISEVEKMDPLREALPETVPHSPAKQVSVIIHASLLRLLRLPTLDAAALADVSNRVAAVCEKWTSQLKGRTLELGGLLFVSERRIIALDGEWQILNFGSAS